MKVHNRRIALVGMLCGVAVTLITNYIITDWQWWLLVVPSIAVFVVAVRRMRP